MRAVSLRDLEKNDVFRLEGMNNTFIVDSFINDELDKKRQWCVATLVNDDRYHIFLETWRKVILVRKAQRRQK